MSEAPLESDEWTEIKLGGAAAVVPPSKVVSIVNEDISEATLESDEWTEIQFGGAPAVVPRGGEG
jgi:hypothetical protein